MLTHQRNNVGLGFFLESNGKTLRFGHDGVHAGFDASLKAYAYLGKGAAVMINKNDNFKATSQIFGLISEHYEWPDYESAKK
jgi:hypothetical protein